MRLALACLVLFACGGGDSDQEGAFSLAWQVLRNDQLIDCASGGVAVVQVVTNDGVATVEEFLCDDGMATTGPRPPGVHTIVVNALDDNDGVVATSGDQASIVAGEVTDLAVFPLDVDPTECDASTCPTGCCDDSGNCIDPQTDISCGIGGIACEDCTNLGATCNATEGVCVQ